MESLYNARIALGNYRFEDVFNNISNNHYHAKLVYLNYLCCMGLYEEITQFIRETDPLVLRQMLNERFNLLNEGTILHVVLNWNFGESACTIFELLTEHGAEYHRDNNGNYPWQQPINHSYLSPFTGVSVGEVDMATDANLFSETKYILQNNLQLDEF
jgi:hypothetical protein